MSQAGEHDCKADGWHCFHMDEQRLETQVCCFCGESRAIVYTVREHGPFLPERVGGTR